MDVNINLDNAFLSPSLPPPQKEIGESSIPLEAPKEKKGLQRDNQGNVVKESKEHKEHNDPTVYSDNSEIHHETTEETQHEHEDEGGQGSGQSGSGDHEGSSGGGSGGFSDGQSDRRGEGVSSFQEELEALIGTGAAPRKSATQMNVKGQAQVLSSDQLLQIDSSVKFNEKYNLGNAFNANDLAALKADYPNLPGIKDFNVTEVIKELKGNAWFNTSYMTAITSNLMEVVRIKMSMQMVEGSIAVALLQVIADLGLALGNLALEKAELEAEMHKFQALAAFLSFGVTVAAGALSIAGLMASTAGGAMKTNAAVKDPGTASAAAGSKPLGGPSGGWTAGKSPASSASTSSSASASGGSSFTASSRSAGSGRADGSLGGSGKIADSKIGMQRDRNADVRVNVGSRQQRAPADSGTPTSAAWQKGTPKSTIDSNMQSGATSQKSASTATGETIKDGSISSKVSGEAKATTSAEGRTGWLNSKAGLKSKKTDAEGLEGPPLTKAEARAIKRAEYTEKGGEIVGSLGQTLTYGSSSLGSAADNLVQWAFLPLIGEKERQIQILQSAKQIAQQALESAMNDMKNAASDIDALLQALMKIQDETSRAHSMNRG